MRYVCLSLTLLTIVGCGSVSTQLRGISPLNVNDINESTPVDVRFYQLRNPSRFEKASFDALWVDAAKVLDEDLLSKPVVETVFPGSANDEPTEVDLGSLHQDCKYIGIIALYRRSDQAPRTLVVPAKQVSQEIIELLGYGVRLASKSDGRGTTSNSQRTESKSSSSERSGGKGGTTQSNKDRR
jgi:type VI secretion system VasD/TssJ family lipoprotein